MSHNTTPQGNDSRVAAHTDKRVWHKLATSSYVPAPMKKLFFPLLSAAALILAGCGETTAEDVRKAYAGMSDEKLQADALHQRVECRAATEDSDKPGSPCSRANTAEEIALSRGWCWGPYAAANSDKSWLRCSDDVTKSEKAKAPWFAATQSGSCRETSLMEAVGKVLEHEGQWNVKTSFSSEGFIDVARKLKDGTSYKVRLYPSCGAAMMLYITKAGDEGGVAVAAPLGMSPRDAGEHFGFDVRNCSAYSFGSGLGCGMGYQAGMQPPIRLGDGFVPCSVDRPVQFDFQPRRGMVGVTCSVTAEVMSAFEQRMATAFGAQEKSSEGSRLWKLGGYAVGTAEVVMLGKTLRRVTVYQE